MNENFLHFLVEMMGTALLVILGNGVIANVVLKKTNGNNGGWLLITLGWGFALAISATICSLLDDGPAALNPAVLIALLMINKSLQGYMFFIYLFAELVGAFLGQLILDLLYYAHIKNHMAIDEIQNAKNDILSMHSTGPSIKNYGLNFLSEYIGTFIFVLAILAIVISNIYSIFAPIMIGAALSTIGMCLGGLTGFSLNPARDLMPRIVYSIIYKNNANWDYSWIPVAAPLFAGVTAGAFFLI